MNYLVELENSIVRNSLNLRVQRVRNDVYLDMKVWDHMRQFVRPGVFVQAVADGVVRAVRKVDVANGDDIIFSENGRPYDLLAKQFMFAVNDGRANCRRIAYKLKEEDIQMMADKGYCSPSLSVLIRTAVTEMWKDYFKNKLTEEIND